MRLRPYFEAAIGRFTCDGQRIFFDTAAFPWVRELEADWRAIRAELDALLRESASIPNFQDLSEDQKILTQGEPLAKEDRAYAAYANEVKKRFQEAESKIATRRSELEARSSIM